MSEIYKRYSDILNLIKEKCEKINRNFNKIKVVAVSKTFPIGVLEEAYNSGIRVFGENYAQELRDKSRYFKDYDIEWHYIGRIQLNKLKYIVPVAYLIHSVTRIEEVEEINKLAAKFDKVQNILIQVNVSGEPTKSGLKPNEVSEFIENAKTFPNVKILGLMTMAPFTDDEKVIRGVFKNTRLLRDKIAEKYPDFTELSMGMSNDFLIAIEEGATILRIGRKIFGERKSKEGI